MHCSQIAVVGSEEVQGVIHHLKCRFAAMFGVNQLGDPNKMAGRTSPGKGTV
jgi:hypothetical protein